MKVVRLSLTRKKFHFQVRQQAFQHGSLASITLDCLKHEGVSILILISRKFSQNLHKIQSFFCFCFCLHFKNEQALKRASDYFPEKCEAFSQRK